MERGNLIFIMKKKISVFVISALMLTATYIYWNYRYLEFHTVDFNGDEFVMNNEKPTPKSCNNLKTVLNYYNEDFQDENGLIYIRYKLYKDEELVWNYTIKANDSVWLTTR